MWGVAAFLYEGLLLSLLIVSLSPTCCSDTHERTLERRRKEMADTPRGLCLHRLVDRRRALRSVPTPHALLPRARTRRAALPVP